MPTLKSTVLIGLLFVVIVAIQSALFVMTSLQHTDGQLLLPLDDVYIHFQYARQLANGQPYLYNAGDGASSGATSLLYPFLLAGGYLLGFRDLLLGAWAILLGAAALWLGMLAVHRLTLLMDGTPLLALLGGMVFGVHGAIVWHYFSGMETGLVISCALWALVWFIRRGMVGFTLSAGLLALLRPEAGALVLIASVLFVWTVRRSMAGARWLWLLLPNVLIGLQPALNWLLTGSVTASGSQAKSIFAAVGSDRMAQLQVFAGQLVTIGWEWLIGFSTPQGWHQIPFLGVFGCGVLIWLMWTRERRTVGLLILLWLLALGAAVATLDTAFWHFRRYQMPMYALAILLVLWGIAALEKRFRHRALSLIGAALLLVGALGLQVKFTELYGVNVGYVYAQPYQMAGWLREQTESDAVIAVHDVGMMRYAGQRITLDIVGLTTAGAAPYWRNGPGSVAEYLLRSQPDYIASYGRGHGYGLGLLTDTALYAPQLAEFVVADWRREQNVALAADRQGIYQPDWHQIEQARAESLEMIGTLYPQLAAMQIVDVVNVADVVSEQEHDYQWRVTAPTVGYATVPLDLPVAGCMTCRLLEGARQFRGEERFRLRNPDATMRDAVLVSWVHASGSGRLSVAVNEVPAAARVVMQMPGNWLVIASPIPAQALNGDMTITIQADMMDEQPYMPAMHMLLTGEYGAVNADAEPVASFQNGAFTLTDFGMTQQDGLLIDLEWYSSGAAAGDYRMFVHLYEDVQQPPVSQWDGYPGNGALPPGNWIHGNRHDTISVDVDALQEGTYQVALGFYDPRDPQQRLVPESANLQVTDDGRLWIGEFRVRD